MKKLFTVSLLCVALSAFSQSFQVGDSVVVKSSAKHWMTGEPISSWVYLFPHSVSQVGSAHHPNGVLLNVDGARSWIKADEIYKSNAQSPLQSNAPETIATTETIIIQKDTIFLHDTIVSIREMERVEYVHDTIVVSQKAETPKPSVSIPDEYRFQFYGDFNQYFCEKTYGAAVEAVFGARMTEYAFIGGGVEFGYWMTGKNAAKSMEFPVFVHSKVYLPIDQRFYPHIEMSLGANLGYRTFTPDETLRPSGFHYGVYAKGGIGIDLLKCLSLAVGYQYGGSFSNVSKEKHHAYLKLGVYFFK